MRVSKPAMLLFSPILITLGSCSLAPISGQFVGEAADSDIAVGLVSNGTAVQAYVCDGAAVSQWFLGDVEGDTFTLSAADNATLSVSRTQDGQDAITAVFARPDQDDIIISAATTAAADAGLFRAERSIDGQDFVGGWIILPSGEQRGAMIGSTETEVFGPALDTETLTANIEGLGEFEAFQVTEQTLP